ASGTGSTSGPAASQEALSEVPRGKASRGGTAARIELPRTSRRLEPERVDCRELEVTARAPAAPPSGRSRAEFLTGGRWPGLGPGPVAANAEAWVQSQPRADLRDLAGQDPAATEARAWGWRRDGKDRLPLPGPIPSPRSRAVLESLLPPGRPAVHVLGTPG